MRIAFVGKGGSGKTTLASLFSQYLATEGFPVLAIDADINQHLAASLGVLEEGGSTREIGNNIDVIKEYVRGDNPRIASAHAMIKTTPPGRGSRLLKLSEPNPLFDRFAKEVGGVRLLSVGHFADEDLGTRCYHSKTGAVELILNHTVDGRDEYVVADMTAGADAFASGLFGAFDLTIVVTEPTWKSIGVYEQYAGYASPFHIVLGVAANKVEDDADVAYVQSRIHHPLIAAFPLSRSVRANERGECLAMSDAEKSALKHIKEALDACQKDWRATQHHMAELHMKNAKGWANAAAGEDLALQIDPEFVLAP